MLSNRKTLFSVLLISSALMLSYPSLVESQSFTTYTSVSTSTVHATSYYTSVGTATSLIDEPELVVNRYVGPGARCDVNTNYFSFTAAKGTKVLVSGKARFLPPAAQTPPQSNWVGVPPFHFWVLNEFHFEYWKENSGSPCDYFIDYYFHFEPLNDAGYGNDFIASTDGRYYVIVFNDSAFWSEGVQFTLQEYVSTASTQTSGYSYTQSLTITQLEEIPQTPSTSQSPLVFAAVAIAVLLVLAVLLSGLSRRRRVRQTTLTAFAPAKLLCGNCGTQLASGSNFCNKCGASQG